MLDLNFSTVEELVFYDKDAQKVLPAHYFSLFEQWRIAKRLPMLQGIGKQALLDFLNGITSEDIALLELYFGDKIIVEKLSYSVTKNITVPLAEAKICDKLCEISEFNYFSTWRDDEHLYISFWR